jgi:serine/threonine protein kinase KIN1/2
MLVTNPALRATLPEVLAHPWMTRSFSGAPDPHLVHREPLRPDDLDPHVIRAMTGFEFGTPEDIQRRLVNVLEQDTYIRAVHAWQQRRAGGSLNMTLNGGARSSSTFSFDSGTGKEPLSPSKATPKKRFSGFDFYRRKMFSPSTSPPSTPVSKSPSASGTTSALSLSQVSDGMNGIDPTRGFHPLISIYYLVREKQERERVYGPGYFASSQLSLQSPQHLHTQAPKSAHGAQDPDGLAPKPPPASFKPPTIRTTPSVTETQVQPPSQQKADYSMPLPLLPAPESSHYSGLSYDTPANLATPSPTHATFAAPQTPQPQPRARDVDLGMQNVTTAPQPPTPVTGALPRAPPVSTHRRSHSLNQRPSVTRGWVGMIGTGTQQSIVKGEPRTAGPDVTSFQEHDSLLRPRELEPEPENEPLEEEVKEVKEVKEIGFEKEKEKEQVKQRINGHTNGSGHEKELPDNPPPFIIAGATLARKFGSLLVGSRGDGHERRGGGKRASILSMSPRISVDSEKEKEKEKDRDLDEKVGRDREHNRDMEEKAEKDEKDQVEPIGHGLRESLSQPLGSIHRRAATILDPAGRAARHERRSSTGASAFVGGTIGRKTKPASSAGPGAPPTIGRAENWRTDILGVGQGITDQRPRADEQGHMLNGHVTQRKEEEVTTEKDFKPVFLKGLFRCVRLCQGCTVLTFSLVWPQRQLNPLR